jgi:predicted Zn-dependent protease
MYVRCNAGATTNDPGSSCANIKACTGTNSDAVYWLSQAELGLFNTAGAKAALQKGMEGANGSNPMLLTAMGQVELLEGKANDARQRFETAVSLSKGKDVGVLNAIGRANLVSGGDAAYGIEKLKMATALMDAQKKGPRDPSVYVTMGDSYKKLMDGGNAVTSYQNALTADPTYAAAKYRIGKIYLTQGNEQKDIFLKNFEDALALDPAYAPAQWKRAKDPLTGHCYGAAHLVQDRFGGEIVKGTVRGQAHAWNRLPGGREVDLTGSQYGGDGLHPLVQGEGVAASRSTNPRFARFAARVDAQLGRR